MPHVCCQPACAAHGAPVKGLCTCSLPFSSILLLSAAFCFSAGAFKNGDVLTVGIDLGNGIVRFSRNGIHLGDAFTGVTGPLVAVVTQASEESKVTIQNRPTVLNMGEYTGELR